MLHRLASCVRMSLVSWTSEMLLFLPPLDFEHVGLSYFAFMSIQSNQLLSFSYYNYLEISNHQDAIET